VKVLLDQNAPRQLRSVLSDHDVRSAYQMGWDKLTNGDLLDAAQRGGFEVVITADRSIRYQQNLSGRRIAIVELDTNHWITIRTNPAAVMAAVAGAGEGTYTVVRFSRSHRPGS
jgi:hypothetical protein